MGDITEFSRKRILQGLSKCSRLFKETGLMGILEDADNKKVDILSPFLIAIIDRCCGLFKGACSSDVFSMKIILLKRAESSPKEALNLSFAEFIR